MILHSLGYWDTLVTSVGNLKLDEVNLVFGEQAMTRPLSMVRSKKVCFSACDTNHVKDTASKLFGLYQSSNLISSDNNELSNILTSNVK